MTRAQSLHFHIELVPGAEGKAYGYTFAFDRSGGSAEGRIDAEATLMLAFKRCKKELRAYLMTNAERAERMARRKEALKRAKEKGLLL